MLKQAQGLNWDAIQLGVPGGSFYSLYWPAVAILPQKYQYGLSATSLSDSVVYEIGAGFKSLPNAKPRFFLDATRGINSAAEIAVLQDFANSPSTDFQLVALEGLLARGQSGTLTVLQQSLPLLAANPQANSVVFRALKDSFRSTDPATVQQLAALAGASAVSPDFRQAAISALAAVHTREALPFLASLLQSQDPEERMKGVFGLSSFANNMPAQTPEGMPKLAFLQMPASGPYQTKQTRANFVPGRMSSPDKEQALVTFWEAWWSQHPELH
jgi:HEAT repeat protein